MANECYFSELMGTANNGALPKLGSFRINCQVGSGTYLNKARFDIGIENTTETVKARIVGDGYFTDSEFSQNLGKEKTLTANGWGNYNVVYIKVNEDCFVDIEGVDYSLVMGFAFVWNCYANLDYLWNCRKFHRLVVDSRYSSDIIQPGLAKKITGHLNKIVYPEELYNFDISRTPVEGDLSFFAELENLYSVSMFYTNIGGNILNFANLGKTRGSFDACMVSYCPSITGTIESLIEAWVADGRTASGASFSAYSSGVTLNNLPAPLDGKLTISSGVATLKDANNQSVYATYDGTNWTYGTW